jgi:hypothetical protein
MKLNITADSAAERQAVNTVIVLGLSPVNIKIILPEISRYILKKVDHSQLT